jgi:hypothetical protein
MNNVLYKAEEEFQQKLAIAKTDPLQPPLSGLLEGIAEEIWLERQHQLKQDRISETGLSGIN